ncbi:hypothetical protein SCHPADRAFT_1001082 [Schizopora paradoxa]|uniref:Uncharacterized protein n=1 Tax=Schizopora paradoxa TaxID=27342 RepID=A0A0H2RA54_9AGAM|nr:hypothetical protein SCHPADRAFT_1001082 [Schizopora paradoxa]
MDHKHLDEAHASGSLGGIRVPDRIPSPSEDWDLIPPDSPSSSYRTRRKLGRINSIGTNLGILLPTRIVSPRQYANLIRRLCGHDETTPLQRHTYFNDEDRNILSREDEKTLAKLCERLLGLTASQSTRAFAEAEIISLITNDPSIRSPFKLAIVENRVAGLTDEFENTILSSESVHKTWTEFLSRRLSGVHRLRSSIDLLADTLTTTHGCERISTAYLTIALAAITHGPELEILRQVWCRYLEYLHGTPFALVSVHLKIFDSYIKSILSSGKHLDDFMSPKQLASLASHLMEDPKVYLSIVRSFFSVPMIRIHIDHRPRKSLPVAKFSYPSPFEDWDLLRASSYALSFPRPQTPGPQDEITESPDIVSSYIPDSSSGSSLAETVFAEESWMALYRVVGYSIQVYRHGGGTPRDGIPESIVNDLMTVANIGFRFFNTSNASEKNEAYGAFYIAQAVDIDRYCKNALRNSGSLSNLSRMERIRLLDSHSRFLNRVRIENGFYEESYIPQFANVPYLRRFQINGLYFITADSLPEPPNLLVKSFRKGSLRHITVDSMLLDGHTLICLHFRGKELPFDCTGHYPILAGYTPFGHPLYVAVLRVDNFWFFTTVRDHASYVVYNNEFGDSVTTSDFSVLALRHSPSDFVSPSDPRRGQARAGARDPTGPVYWLRFWPRKDSEYFKDKRLADDVLLKTFLDGLSCISDI